MLESVEGEFEHVIFRNEENDYTIGRLKVPGRRDPVVIIGTLCAVPGETLLAKGTWVNDKQYGPQFKITEYRAIVPATVHGIERYLASGLIRGIGPVYAKRLVAHFGLETLAVIEQAPDKLKEVEGIGLKRIERIRTAWKTQKGIKSIMLFLLGHGVSTTYAARIQSEYGNEAIHLIQTDPYRLARDIVGIGFIKADQIARNLGIAEDSPLRARAGLLHILSQGAADGHVFLPLPELISQATGLLALGALPLRDALAHLIESRHVISEETPGGTAIYLPYLYHSESGIASHLQALRSTASGIRPIDPSKAISWVEERIHLSLAEEQKQAVADAITQKGVIITGGPGTGKTTIVRAIVSIFQVRKAKILLAAPTGRAAKRLSESTGMFAQTIHRMLSSSPRGFQKNAEHPLDVDVLIIDELSMVDTVLFYHLMKAVPRHATVILVGDAHQLPSVGAGQVLADLINSGFLPTVTLVEIFRQAKRSLIVRNAHRMLLGEFPYLPPFSKEAPEDFLFIEQEEPEQAVEQIRWLVEEEIPKRLGVDPLDGIQVLCPMNRGTAGVENLNRTLQASLNPSGIEIQRGSRLLRQGDKVMQSSNNYAKGVFNGDIGRILVIDSEERVVSVEFDSGRVQYDFSELDEMVPAYAISVHKSQGSEYPAVVLPILAQHYILLQRNLLYTAVTRAKRLLVIVGTKKAIGMAIANDSATMRHSLLADRLRRGLSPLLG